MMEQRQFEEEEDIESTAGNFHQVAKEAGLSPKSRLRKGKKSKRQNQNKEQQKPIRLSPRRTASLSK